MKETREQKILKMYEEGRTLQEIGDMFHFSRSKPSARKSFRKSVFLDTKGLLLFYQLQVFPSTIQPLFRRLLYAKISQNVYALLLIGIVCLLGA